MTKSNYRIHLRLCMCALRTLSGIQAESNLQRTVVGRNDNEVFGSLPQYRTVRCANCRVESTLQGM